MSVNIKTEGFDDSLLENEPLLFDIDEAFFDDFFNIEDPSTTPEDSVDTAIKEELGVDGIDDHKKRKSLSAANGGGSVSTATSATKKTRKEFVPEELSRIPKSDVRRTFPKLFADIFNGQDKQETIKLLERIALSDLVVTHRFVGGNNPTGPAAFDVHGINAVATFWDTYQQAVPDSVFEILETKIRVSSTDRRSAILCKWISKGTKVLKLQGLSEGSEEKVVLSSVPGRRPTDSTDLFGNTILNVEPTAGKNSSSNNNSNNKTSTGISCNSNCTPNNSSSSGGGANTSQNYTTTTIRSGGSSGIKFGLGDILNEKIFRVGTMTIQLNSAKKIYRLDFVYSNKKSMINI